MVKEEAPELLRKELSSPKWRPAGAGDERRLTDCYQPVEKTPAHAPRCLEVLLEFRNPVVIVTKNYLVTRDIDIFCELARYQCVGVTISLTTLDPKLRSVMEPRALKSGTPASRNHGPRGSRNSSWLPSDADDSRPDRFRGAGHRPSRRRSRRDLCRLRCLALAVRREGSSRNG